MKKFVMGVAALAMPFAMTFSGPSAHAAITKTGVSGTVNCTGSITTYNTVRYMDGYNNIQMYLTKAAYSNRGGTGMTLGAYIVAANKAHRDWVVSANRWATFSTSAYRPDTRFRVQAAMDSSSGACHNSWAANLHY